MITPAIPAIRLFRGSFAAVVLLALTVVNCDALAKQLLTGRTKIGRLALSQSK